MKRCPQCGKQYATEANFCPIDAGRLEEVPDDAPAEPDDQVLGGRFVLGDHVGDGGMTGQVFAATDNQTGAHCVVKWVDRDVFASPLQMQRTERELKQLERATATGVARILGHGRKGERLWFATEHFEGTSLRDLVASGGPLPAERAAKLVHAVGTALSEAAKLGVIHRDVAPKNVLVGADDAVKVINFGVAVPATPSVRGVPEYVAPEQVDGKPVDQRSNIYSLGAMYFFLVAGRPPFEGDVQTVHSAHLHSPPPKPSEHAESVPPEVDKLIDRALAKQSSKRYMTLRQLLGELEKVSGVEPSSTAKMGAARKKKTRTNPAAQTMLGVGALSSEVFVEAQRHADGAAPADAVADLAPPIDGRMVKDTLPDPTPAGKGADDFDDKATTKMAVTSRDAAAASGEIGSTDDVAAIVDPSPSNGASQQPVSGELGGDDEPPADQPAARADEAPAADDDEYVDDDDGDDSDETAAATDDEDFDSRATQPTKNRKKKRRRRRRRKTKNPKKSDDKFRDTMWFKQGEGGEGGDGTGDDERPPEDRYGDDGTLTDEDEERLSLRTGDTSSMEPITDEERDRARVTGALSEKDLVDEMTGGGRRLMYAGIAVLLIAGVVVAIVLAMGD